MFSRIPHSRLLLRFCFCFDFLKPVFYGNTQIEGKHNFAFSIFKVDLISLLIKLLSID